MPIQVQRVGGGVSPTSSQLGATKRWVINTILWQLYSPSRSGNLCIGRWVDLGVSLDGTENPVPPGFDPPIRDMMPRALVEVHRCIKEICRLQLHGCASTTLGISTSLKTAISSPSPLQWPTIIVAHKGGSLRLMLPEKCWFVSTLTDTIPF
jgi:hypothetical protein